MDRRRHHQFEASHNLRLMSRAIELLEERARLRKELLDAESWDVMNEVVIGNSEEALEYQFRKEENTSRRQMLIREIMETQSAIKRINSLQQIRIPIERFFARVAQGAVITRAVLPNGVRMYDSVGEYEWVVQGDDAVLQKIETD